MKFYDELKYRGLIKDVSDEKIEKLINEGNITFYWGTDPSADSLHLGHYSSLVTAKRFAQKGNQFILLLGGATGLIGDPRPSAERQLISSDAVNQNIKSIENQVKNIVDKNTIFVNNYDWMKDYNFLDFLRDVGKHINVSYMLNKDIISRRLETGITYAEFSYTLMQGYDFVYLNRKYNCNFQVAGSDQWGNITTGIELSKKMDNKEVYGITMPLILDSTGKKFGKSEGNALWLDKNKTSPYQIYQYLINTSDSLVIDYLKVFTFLSIDEIERIEQITKERPEERLAQKTLAYEVVKDIHGVDEANNAKKTSEDVFSKGYSENGMISKDIDLFDNMNIMDLLVNIDIAPSKSEAKRLVLGNAISINSNKITDEKFIINSDLFKDGSIVVSKGKKTFIKVNLVK